MRPDRRSVRSPDDFENLAKAFEGMAGALHAGVPLDWEDAREAARLAHTLWPIRGGGKEWAERQFEDARHECLACLPAAADGDIRACMQLEKACHHLATALQWRARNLAPPRGSAAARPWDAAHDVRAGIRRLDRAYARYALRALPIAT